MSSPADRTDYNIHIMRAFLNRSASRRLVAVLALVALTVPGAAQERERAQIQDQYKWNLADIYPDIGAWRAAKDRLPGQIPRLGQFRNRLASSPETLAEALDTMYALDKE